MNTGSVWYQLSYPTEERLVAAISSVFEHEGALAITLSDEADHPVFEPHPDDEIVWPATRVTALFNGDVDLDHLLLACYSAFSSVDDGWPGNHGSIVVERIQDQAWERAWMRDFVPMQFGENLWICPSNHQPIAPQAINLKLDPGLAFGTGTHPTTAMCLRFLAQTSELNRRQHQHMLDFGCGSGVLAIAGLLLGIEQATGVDIDPLALEASANNAKANEVNDRLVLSLADDYQHLEPTTLLVANILARPLTELAERFSQYCEPSADLVLSGILSEQADWVIKAYNPYFDMRLFAEQDGWVCLVGQRR